MSAIFPRDPNEIARGSRRRSSLLGPLRLPFLRPDLSVDQCTARPNAKSSPSISLGLIVIRLYIQTRVLRSDRGTSDVPRPIPRIPCATHLFASPVRTPTWLTARLTRFAFVGCDDKHSQAQRWFGVRLPDPAGRGVGCHRPGHVGLASYYTERGESPGAWIGSLAWSKLMVSAPGMR
jgi:hypothetical protein